MMYHGIFDTHAHYDDESFAEDRFQLLDSLPSQGVGCVVNCGVNPDSSLFSSELAHKYDYIYFAAGVHPSDCLKAGDEWLEKIKSLAADGKCVAIGEIGLDYHYDDTPRDIQIEFFEKQLILAKELSLPVIVHDREAHEDTLTLLKKYRPEGVLHCFSGSVESMKEIVGLGMYIGLGGAVTFKNAKKPVEVAKQTPADRLLLETDCPYMTPVPLRGKRNNSAYISYTAEFIASVRGMDTQEYIDITNRNACTLFGLDRK